MKNIISFKNYICGTEKFNLSELYNEYSTKNVELPINVFLMEHKKFGHILFNAGCSTLINKNKILAIKYKSQHKLSFGNNDNIVTRLSKDSFDPVLIKKVILTHANPECCGGLPLLPKYQLLSSAQVLTTLDFGTFEENVLKSTVPPKNIERRAVVPYKQTSFLNKYFKWVYDILGDGSVLGFDLSGHSKTMMGYYISELNILFAGDAAITDKSITEDYTPTNKLLEDQYYPDDYLLNFELLKSIHKEHPKIKFLVLHSETDI